MSGLPYHTGPGLGGNHGVGSAAQALHNYSNQGASQSGSGTVYISSQGDCTPNPIENTGLKVGEIIGFRMWHIKDNYLVSYSASHAWPPGEVMNGDPKEDNNEGIWSFKEKSRALNKMLECGDSVMGSIKMWGRIIEYTQGYRAEFARIVSLEALRPRDDKLLKKLQSEYGVSS